MSACVEYSCLFVCPAAATADKRIVGKGNKKKSFFPLVIDRSHDFKNLVDFERSHGIVDLNPSDSYIMGPGSTLVPAGKIMIYDRISIGSGYLPFFLP